MFEAENIYNSKFVYRTLFFSSAIGLVLLFLTSIKPILYLAADDFNWWNKLINNDFVLLIPIALIMRFPGALIISKAVYRKVAKNRKNLGCSIEN